MKRLTYRHIDGSGEMDCKHCDLDTPDKPCTALACRNRMKDRLCDYEDTGLSPEQIMALIKQRESENGRLTSTTSEPCHEKTDGKFCNNKFWVVVYRDKVTEGKIKNIITAPTHDQAVVEATRDYCDRYGWDIVSVKDAGFVFRGDISNDCAGCMRSDDYHFVDGECVRREA